MTELAGTPELVAVRVVEEARRAVHRLGSAAREVTQASAPITWVAGSYTPIASPQYAQRGAPPDEDSDWTDAIGSRRR